ncbi:MAG: FlaD/FlaE family flagellar protein [Halobellus sp.]|uniref:FlaD/FlaE family flagellar protein n=1 Tax=Halobellus sp. TaxID=1979212 RepID=UPI0035D4E6D9
MTIDPDDYDLRELRRIADQRRKEQNEDGATREGDDSCPRPSGRRRRGRRNGRNTDRRDSDGHRRDGRHRNGRADDEEEGRRHVGSSGRRYDGQADDDRRNGSDDEISVRPREDVSPPRRGRSAHADAHADVVRADRIASDLGLGGVESHSWGRGESRRRPDPGYADGRPRSLNGGYDTADDVGRFQFDTEVRERPRGRAGEALRQNQLEQLLVRETASVGSLDKPYLSSLPDAYAAERIVFDWLEFLALKGGYKRTMDAIRYYHTVDWLTEDVETELQDYLVGFSGEVTNTSEFDVDDHHLSLVYIARLASME